MHSTSVKEMFYFKAIRCCNSVLGENILCVECSNQLFFLQRKCYDAARMRTEGISNTKTNNTYLCNSPLLLIFKVDWLSQSAKREKIRQSKTKAREILKTTTEREGINRSTANLEEVFPENLKELASKFFDKKNISQDSLVQYLFQETLVQARAAIKSGNRSNRYSPVMIMFCIGFRDKLKMKVWIPSQSF